MARALSHPLAACNFRYALISNGSSRVSIVSGTWVCMLRFPWSMRHTQQRVVTLSPLRGMRGWGGGISFVMTLCILCVTQTIVSLFRENRHCCVKLPECAMLVSAITVSLGTTTTTTTYQWPTQVGRGSYRPTTVISIQSKRLEWPWKSPVTQMTLCPNPKKDSLNTESRSRGGNGKKETLQRVVLIRQMRSVVGLVANLKPSLH